jgi:hypothetical protein
MVGVPGHRHVLSDRDRFGVVVEGAGEEPRDAQNHERGLRVPPFQQLELGSARAMWPITVRSRGRAGNGKGQGDRRAIVTTLTSVPKP